jgi:hypothetical protein
LHLVHGEGQSRLIRLSPPDRFGRHERARDRRRLAADY